MSPQTPRRRTRIPAYVLFAIAAVCAVTLTSLAIQSAATPSSSEAATNYPTMTPALTQPTVVFIGGSVTAGAGANGQTSRWSSRLSADKGWAQVNLASASNIALVPADKGCIISVITTCADYRQIVVETERRDPRVIVVAVQLDPDGSASAVGAAAGALLAALRAGLPNVTIIAVGPALYPKIAEAGVTSIDQAVRTASVASRAIYVSLLAPPVLSPATIAPTGDTPNDAGHAAIAAAVNKAIP